MSELSTVKSPSATIPTCKGPMRVIALIDNPEPLRGTPDVPQDEHDEHRELALNVKPE